MKNTVVLVNPLAAKGRGRRTWTTVCQARPDLAQARLIECETSGQAAQQLAQSLSASIQQLIVIGGDGTLHMAANHLLNNGLGEQLSIGLIPAGTGSDYARILELPRDPVKALEHALNATPKKVDVLRISGIDGNNRYAVNTFSAGVSGWVSQQLSSTASKGPAAYLRTTLKAFVNFEAVDCRVRVDNQPWFDGPLYLLAVTKGSHFGQGMHISPRARLDSGLSEIIAVAPMSRWRLPLRLCRLYLGNHLSASYVRYRQGRTVQIEQANSGPGFEIDGESTSATPVSVDTLPAALSLMA